MSDVSATSTLIVALVGGAFCVALIAVFGSQVFASTRTANTHLARAAQLAPGASPPADAPAITFAPTQPGERALHAVGDVPHFTHLDDLPAKPDVSAHVVERLNQYYAANISQGTAIFWASLLSMAIGFAIVFFAIVTVRANTTIAIVAGVAGVLSQFIAATFLVALRSTQQQSTTYAQTLVELRQRDARAAADTESIRLGLQLLREISGNGADALANQTRAALAMALIAKSGAPAAWTLPVAPPPADDDRKPDGPAIDHRVRAQSVSFDTAAADVDSGAKREP